MYLHLNVKMPPNGDDDLDPRLRDAIRLIKHIPCFQTDEASLCNSGPVLYYSVLLFIIDTLLCRHHPLLGEFRSNSMSGGRPSVVSKTNIGPSNSFGGGGALLYNNTSTRHNSHKVPLNLKLLILTL